MIVNHKQGAEMSRFGVDKSRSSYMYDKLYTSNPQLDLGVILQDSMKIGVSKLR